MAVTRADVARLADTSPALVSYVINGGPRAVAPATRSRILAAIDELGYRPNVVARSLRTARGNLLGLIVPDSSNPYFARLARAVEDASHAHGYPLLVGNAAEDPAREVGYLRAFADRQVEGMLVIPTVDSASIAAEYTRAPCPIVVLDRALDSGQFASVVADAFDGARTAVTHLIEHGHTRIACLSGPDLVTTRQRVAGYRAALSDAGLEPTAIVERPFGGADGYTALGELLDRPDTVSAVFVTSDLAAMGLLRAAFDRGIDVPADLAVASFDGIEHAAYTRPGLTTIAQPIGDLSRQAVQLVIQAIGGSAIEPGERALPTHLVRRGSCGCPDHFTPADLTD